MQFWNGNSLKEAPYEVLGHVDVICHTNLIKKRTKEKNLRQENDSQKKSIFTC